MVGDSLDGSILPLLEEVLDPEVPALSIVDLGIVREVFRSGNTVTIVITPTYSGCPAMDTIRAGIRERLQRAGFEQIEIKTVLTPAWTTEWISERGRKKLKEYGIAPPGGAAQNLVGITPKVPCPFCDSKETELRSRFGATACKALYYCRACKQPFEHFKDF